MLQQSQKKIEVIEGICKATTVFMEDLGAANKGLNSATSAIGLSKIDKFYNGLTATTTQAKELSDAIADGLDKLVVLWTSRDGMAPQAIEAFEGARSFVSKLRAVPLQASPVELSNDLNEDYSPETMGAFKKSLYDFCSAKDGLIKAVSSAILDNITEDTKEIFTSYGKGIESFSNALVDVFDANSAAIASFDLGVEELTTSMKSSTANLLSSTQEVAQKATRASMDVQ